jgi:hypothetical protein
MTASQTFTQRLYDQASSEDQAYNQSGAADGAASDDEVVDAEVVDAEVVDEDGAAS